MSYLNSNAVHVYPCANRGANTDLESKLNTEYNLTHLGTLLGKTRNYVEPIDTLTSTSILKFWLHGYYFEADINDLSLQINDSCNLWAAIKLKQVDLVSNGDKTWVLASYDDSSSLDDGGKFKGLVFNTSKIEDNISNNVYAMQVIANGQTCNTYIASDDPGLVVSQELDLETDDASTRKVHVAADGKMTVRVSKTTDYDGTSEVLATGKAIKSAIETLAVNDLVQDSSGSMAGKTLATLLEEDGKIEATFQNISINSSQINDVQDTYSGTNGKAISGKGVKVALETLDVSDLVQDSSGSMAGKTLKTLSETNGIIAATFQDIQIAESQVTNLTTDLDKYALKTTSISAGVGLTGGGDLSTNRTIKANLVNESKSTNASSYTAGGASKFYAVQIDTNDKLSVYVPWTDTAGAADNILTGSNNGTQITYAPYTTKGAGHLYNTDSTNPSSTNALKYDGYFYATKLYTATAPGASIPDYTPSEVVNLASTQTISGNKSFSSDVIISTIKSNTELLPANLQLGGSTATLTGESGVILKSGVGGIIKLYSSFSKAYYCHTETPTTNDEIATIGDVDTAITNAITTVLSTPV